MKNPQVQEEAAIKLYEYLQKHSEDTDSIFDQFKIRLEQKKSEEKHGILLALNKILGISRETQIVHYVNKLIPVLVELLKTNNIELVEKGAECLGNLAEAGGSITAEVINDSLKSALFWLASDTNPRSQDIKKYSAVLILREYIKKLPVITFNKLFDTQENSYKRVIQAFNDQREKVRNVASEVINECIKQIDDRKGLKTRYVNQTKLIYMEVEKAFKEPLDTNFQHAALSVIAALISHKVTKHEIIDIQQKGSVVTTEVMKLLQTSRNALVRKRCIEIIPALYKYITAFFNQGDNLDIAMKAILEFVKIPGNKDRGQGFLSIGKMSLIVDHKTFEQYIDRILELIQNEVRVPPKTKDGMIKPFADLDSLTCMKYLLRNFGPQLKQKIDMYNLINDIFYTGYNRQVIECLGEIAKCCRGEFKRAAQVKLLNSCSIILTQKRDMFPQTLEDSFIVSGPEAIQMEQNRANRLATSNGASGSKSARDRRSSDEESKLSERESMQFGTMIDEEDAYDDKRKKGGGGTRETEKNTEKNAQNGQKQILKNFYAAVLNKDNQKFLHDLVKQSNVPTAQDNNNTQNSTTERTTMVTLALRTLQMFDFDALAMCIVYFIETSVLNFLDDENPMVRKEAMQTCCGLSFPQNDRLRISSGMERIINKLLHKFFVTATTDNEDRIRVTMLKYLNPQFDPFISKYENLLMLFNCMQDQSYEIKERTVRILGRLVPHNAAQILPYLRQLLISFISQLEQSNDTKEREEAVRLIKIYVKYAPDLSRAYSTSILKCLISKLDGERATSAFVSAILNVISEISKINSEAIKPYLGELFPLILECLKDQSSTSKRQQAIQTLISIIENTGFVVKPYFYFPEILQTISNLVQTDQSVDIHKLIFRLIGTLGAVDPYLVKQIKLSSDSGSTDQTELPHLLQLDENDAGMKKIRSTVNAVKGKKDEKNVILPSVAIQAAAKLLVPIDDLNLSKENKYPAMAIHQLLKVMVDPNLRDHHQVCIDSIIYLIRNQPDCMPFMPMLIPPLMHLLQQNQNQLTQSLFKCLNIIIQFVPEAMIVFAEPIFDMIHRVIQLQPIPVIHLLAQINVRYKNKLFSYMYLVLPKVLSIIEDSRRRAEQFAAVQEQKSYEMIRITKEAVIHLPFFDYQILDDHLYLIVPLLLRTASRKFINSNERELPSLNKKAVQTLNEMVNCSTFREHTAQVIHQLLRILESSKDFEQDLDVEIIGSFCKIASKLRADFAPYISLIQKALKRNRLAPEKCNQFDLIIKQITKLDPIEQFQYNLESPSIQQIYDESQSLNMQNMQASGEARVGNTVDLLREFDTSKCHISEDWNEWLKKTSHQLLKQNPSPVLFACSTLTEVYAPLATELYNIAFVSCWKKMNDRDKRQIMIGFQKAIDSSTKTTQVQQVILNLAEFMELDENADIKLFSAKTLANIAEQCNAYAKALYYWEQEFDSDPRGTIQLLIQTNYGLQQPEAAEGILEYAKKNLLLDGTEDWYEKLQKWPEALQIYDKKQVDEQNFVSVNGGKLNCYRNLMDWEKLSDLVDYLWTQHISTLDVKHKEKTKNIVKDHAQDAAYAAWNLGKWEDFKRYARHLESNMAYERCFFSAVLEIQQKQFNEAMKHIDRAREVLSTKITSLLGESYNRAYQQIKELQFLKELEEVIEYKKTNSQEKKTNLYKCWINRQKSMPSHDLEAHQMILNIRCLVIDKKDEVDNYIQFAKMAQENQNPKLGSRILISLQNELQRSSETLQIEESKQGTTMFVIRQEQKKLANNMAKVEIAISDQLYNQGNPGSEESFINASQQLESVLSNIKDIDNQIVSQCYQKLATWQFEYLEINRQTLDIKDEDYKKIVDNCTKATQINPSNAEAWHIFSTTNDSASIFYSKKFSREFRDHAQLLGLMGGANQSESSNIQFLLHREFGHKFLPKLLAKKFHPLAHGTGFETVHSMAQDLGKKYVTHVTSAVKGLVQQLFLSAQTHGTSTTKTLQTTLRLLKIWFQHGNLVEIEQNLKQGFEKIDLKVWIEVIPQLLARIDINDHMIKQTLIELVEKISMKFPQALIYSLSVTQKSTLATRRQAADQLIEKLKTTQPVLIEQAQTISNELNRSAILLCEVWKEAIEEASRIYFERNEPKAMYQYIIPFHKEMEKEPETMNEIAFYQGYASELLDAYAWMQRFNETENIGDINIAWDIYYAIFRKISAKQKEVQFYELRNVAPKLLASENLEIAVPGTFKSNKKIVKIQKFDSRLPVLPSKQHPRRMKMHGNDGREYLYLLKGHEDLRQDERVMQLFGLVNTLLSIDEQTSKKDLTIKKYPVIPLSQNTGLIGWVSNCDTLHVLIKDHREESGIIPTIEYKLMEQMCEHFDICPLPNKVEIFRNALEKTLGEDIQKVLWLKSQNSEVWLDRRTNYTRSLAVMSMVGYILGLGDRHPSNIMLERYTGKIVHIDFGDCFEIAMRREKFPEKIPFRLTRMLIRAMEVSGIEGNFRTTCENTMRVMRENKESLLAIMEAFVYDPLISFRLLNPEMFKKHKQQEEEKDGEKPKLVQIKLEKEPEEAVDILAEIDKQQTAQIRESIVDSVLNRLQGNHYEKGAMKLQESKFSRHVEDNELRMLMQKENEDLRQDELNQIAEIVIQRIQDKLRGNEFHNPNKTSERENGMAPNANKHHQNQQRNYQEQVDILIKQAMSHENLASCYIGWCPYW